MNRKITEFLFSRKNKAEISKDTLRNISSIKKTHPEKAIAQLISYVLKFKRTEILSTTKYEHDFAAIRKKSLEIYNDDNSKSINLNKGLRFIVAASVVLFFSVGSYFLGEYKFFSNQETASEIIEFKTPKGQQTEIVLPDGTFVALNFDSRLNYHISRSKSLQKVELHGEAFFKVTKNENRTFRVITDKMNVNVLGTEFNIRAYDEDNKVETTLLEGSIEIRNISNHRSGVLLKPGQRWSYNKLDNTQETFNVNANQSTLWRNGEYYFEKISFGELAKNLERMYDITIHFEDSKLRNEVYSGSVFKDDKIEEILEIIDLTIPINYKKEKKEIWISSE
ncbi:FecR family protein [Sunxiuqinia sp. A32]|uniref:FecR family protein n=1 Tax=Sunxiuqinia sp. A32 TaxID=3461496 RepID=UPI00404590A0